MAKMQMLGNAYGKSLLLRDFHELLLKVEHLIPSQSGVNEIIHV